MKYKVGDIVLLKDKKWYDENKDKVIVLRTRATIQNCIDVKYLNQLVEIRTIVEDDDIYISNEAILFDDQCIEDVCLYSIGEHVKLKPPFDDMPVQTVIITGVSVFNMFGKNEIWYSHKDGQFVKGAVYKTEDMEQQQKINFEHEYQILTALIKEKDKLINNLLDRLQGLPELKVINCEEVTNSIKKDKLIPEIPEEFQEMYELRLKQYEKMCDELRKEKNLL